MGSSRIASCFLLAVVFSFVVHAEENNTKPCEDAAFGYELVQQRLEQLQFSFMEVFGHIKELGESVAINQRTIEQNQMQTNQLIQTLEVQVRANVSLMVDYSKQILDLQTICANHDSIRKEMLKINPILGSRSCHREPKSIESSKTDFKLVESCGKTNSTTSGLFKMVVADFDQPVEVFCEMQKFDGGWLVFQHRFDGSVDFYRNWTEFKNGFGTPTGEFWLGLEKLHQITKQGSFELMIELETFTGNYTYARFSEFQVGSESEKYPLNKLGTYSGTAGDALSYHKGMKFSTFDSDNDEYSGENCAILRTGAWWHKECNYSNLNGKYLDKFDSAAVFWNTLMAGIKSVRMMIRKK